MNQVVFYLMTEKGLAVLESAIKNGHSKQIAYVVIGEDKNLTQDFSEAIKTVCVSAEIPFDLDTNKPTVPKSNYAIAISWRWIIPITDRKLIIIHDSLLPKQRGFAPLVTALMNKETTIGATAIVASEEYDRGDIICQIARSIEYPIKIQSAIQIVSEIYEELVEQILITLDQNRILETTPQVENLATYSVWRDEEDYLIDWSKSAEDIQLKVDATGYPYKSASSYVNNTLVRILDVTVIPDVKIENRDHGKIIFMNENKPVVICGTGLLRIDHGLNDDGTDFLPLKMFRVRFKQSVSGNN